MATAVLDILPTLSIPESELRFRTSRSSGPGGQNVNKLETRVELLFDLDRSPSLTVGQKQILRVTLSGRLDGEGYLHVVSQRSRSQYENRILTVEHFAALLRKALTPKRKRVATQPSRSARMRRLERKRLHGLKKNFRRSGGHSPEEER